MRRERLYVCRGFVISLLGLFLAVTSCLWLDGQVCAEVVDRIVAVVNNDIILLSELNQAMSIYERAVKKRNLPAEQERKLLYDTRKEVLDQLINSKLITQRANELGIKVNESEVDDTIEQLKRSMLYTDEDLRRSLEKEGLTLEEYRDRIRDQLLQRRVLNYEIKSKVVVTSEDVENYYKAHPELYGLRKLYHLRNIIMRTEETGGQEPKETVYAKMADIRRQLEDGASFVELAGRYSQSSFAEKGGDLGFFDLNDLSEQLREAVKELKPGEFTPVLDTPQGYQIIFVEEIEEKPRVSLEDAYENIKEKLYSKMVDKRFEEWITGIRENSYIKIMM